MVLVVSLFACENNEVFEEFKKLFGNEYNIKESREDFEYIYKKSDLADLNGKKYHQKRNHISAFSRQYNWSFEPLSKENLNEVLETAENTADYQRGFFGHAEFFSNVALKLHNVDRIIFFKVEFAPIEVKKWC